MFHSKKDSSKKSKLLKGVFALLAVVGIGAAAERALKSGQ